MLENTINLINDLIEKLIANKNNSSLNKEELVKLEEDYNNILNIELDKVKEALETLSFTDDEKQVIFKFIKSIQTLLKLNSTKKTTFTISDQQLKHLQIFIEKAKEQNLQKEEEINRKIKRLIDLRTKLQSETAFVKELEQIEEIFNELNTDITTRKQILIEIMMFNKQLFTKQMTEEKKVPVLEKLNQSEVEDLFQRYGYDFSKLKPKQQEFILVYASLTNMEEVFETLKNLNFPHFNLPKDSTKLATILINCDKKTIEMVVDFSKYRGITPYDLTSLIPVLIEQKSRNVKKNTTPPGQPEETPLISGKSKDYMDNVEFLENQGFDIQYIYSKCRELLVVNHERLKQNFEAFNLYGFTFDKDEYGNLTHPALSCFLSNNFIEIVDQFIEICPRGFDYIRENMSRVMTYSDPQALIFYNIYASYMEENEYGDTQIPEGPFNKHGQLRGEITRYAGSGYKNIPYRGVTEENKRQKTDTIEPPIQNKEKFDEKVQEVKLECILLKDLTENDERLASLEEYTDESSPYKYNFNGTIISKLKVKRIYNILKNYGLENEEDSLLYAVLYNTIINQHDFDKVKEIVKSRSK